MRAQVPCTKLLRSHGRYKLYERKVNQNPLYLVTYNGVTRHYGKRRHTLRKFNQLTGRTGIGLYYLGD